MGSLDVVLFYINTEYIALSFLVGMNTDRYGRIIVQTNSVKDFLVDYFC